MTVVDRLGSLQFDPLEVAGRNHDLVLLARIADYRREWTDALLYEERRLYETYNKGLSLVPTAELPWYRVTWDRNRHRARGRHVRRARPARRGAPRPDPARRSAQLDRRRAARRRSTGTGDPTNQVRAILEALGEAGILGLAPARRQPPGLRPGRAAVPRGAPRPARARARPAPPQAPVALPRPRPPRPERLGRAVVRDGARAQAGRRTNGRWADPAAAPRRAARGRRAHAGDGRRDPRRALRR